MHTENTTATADALNDTSRHDAVASDHRAAGNPYEAAFEALEVMADAEEIPVAVIGGAAAIHHGSPRPTAAIDVAVAAPDLARLLRECPRYGFRVERADPAGACELTYQNVLVKVWQQGLFADDLDAAEALPHPEELGVTRGLGFATLPAWVRLKLARGLGLVALLAELVSFWSREF